jgi:hypothetical protein
VANSVLNLTKSKAKLLVNLRICKPNIIQSLSLKALIACSITGRRRRSIRPIRPITNSIY